MRIFDRSHFRPPEHQPPELPPEPEPEFLSPRQIAALLGVHPETVKKYIRSGALPSVALPGGRTIRVRRSDLDAFLDR